MSSRERLRRWLPIGLASATRFGASISMGTALAEVVEAQATPFEVGLVGAAFYGGLMLAAPVWGAIADITGRRRAVLLVVGVGATVAAAALAAVETVGALIALRALYALFAAGFAPVVLAIVSRHGGASGRGRSVGVYNSTRAAGISGGHFVAGVLLGLVAPAAIFLVIAGLSAVSTVVALTVGDPTPNPERALRGPEVAREVRRRLLPAVGERAHLRTNGLRWLYVALVLRNVTVLGVMTLMAPYLTGPVGVPAAVMGALLAINPASQVVFMTLFGYASDLVGRKPLIVAGMAGSAAFGLVASTYPVPGSFASTVALAAGGFLLLAASFSTLTTGTLAFIGDVAPPNRESELMGLKTTARGLGGTVGPLLLGGVAAATGYRTAFAASALLALAGTALVALALVESRAPAAAGVPADDD